MNPDVCHLGDALYLEYTWQTIHVVNKLRLFLRFLLFHSICKHEAVSRYTSNSKISSKNNNQYVRRESHWYLHSWTGWIEYDKQCTIEINSNGCTVYKHHVQTNRATVAGREKGLIIFENYSILNAP